VGGTRLVAEAFDFALVRYDARQGDETRSTLARRATGDPTFA